MDRNDSMQNIKIAICEDNASDMEKLMSYIYEIVPDANISGYTTAEAFLTEYVGKEEMGAYPHLIFFDICMKGMNGMEAARKLREYDENCTIVFTTSSPDYAIEGYKVNAEDYFLKPVEYEDIKNLMNKILAESGSKGQVISITSDYRRIDLPLSRIIYIEVNDKYCIFHTANENIKSRIPMNDLEQKLSEPFLRCHRGYIVNLDYVKSISDKSEFGSNFIMKNDDIVLIRKNEYNIIKEEYLRYLMNSAENR